MKTYPLNGDIQGWAKFLASTELPILDSTQRTLSKLKIHEDRLLPSELATIILRDPLHAALLIRFIQHNKNKLRSVDITTTEHALMMLGIEPFYRLFGTAETLKEKLSENKTAIQSVMKVARRSYIASRLAQDWAAKKMDIESEEIQVAALIHDVAEMLLWIKAPAHAYMIKQMMEAKPDLRSVIAQRKVLGVSLVDVEIEICELWGLPELLIDLLKSKTKNSRMNCLELAVKIARHSAVSFENPALPDDWNDLTLLLGYGSPEVAKENTEIYITKLARKWDKHNLLQPQITNQEQADEDCPPIKKITNDS